MKRYNDLYKQVYDLENIRLGYNKARKGKGNRYGVKLFDQDLEANLLALHEELKNKTYKTSEYSIFIIYEPKEREIYRLPFRDRVVHHAIMNIIEPIWVSIFTSDTFSCIKKRGIHGAQKAVLRDLKSDIPGTEFCLKGDIKKFYPSIDHEILKMIARRKIKDKDLLELIDEIIDSAPGVPIGNYLSQYLANLYLAYFDHDIKTCFGLAKNEKALEAYIPYYIERTLATAKDKDLEEISKGPSYLADKFKQSVKSLGYYYRYADDFVILHNDRVFLHILIEWIGLYLSRELKLLVKHNWQVYRVEDRGVDFVGYIFRHEYTLLRKTIKKNFFRKVSKAVKIDPEISKKRLIHTVCSYYGWCLHCDSKHLLQTIFKRLNDEVKFSLPKTVDLGGSRQRDGAL